MKQTFRSILIIPVLICFSSISSQPLKTDQAKTTNSMYQIPWNVIASGGCIAASSGSNTVSATAGQVFAGPASSANHTIYSGFFNPSIIGTITSVDSKIEEQLPMIYHLEQNYPNPFNPITTINYALPELSEVVIEIYNITGRQVTTLKHENQEAGYHSIQWNGMDHLGNSVGSGIYCYRLKARSLKTEKGFVRTMKMLFVK
jgi:hypothetical protein